MMKLLKYLLMGFVGVVIVAIITAAAVVAAVIISFTIVDVSVLINEWFGMYALAGFWFLGLSALLGYGIYRINNRGNEDE